MKQNIQDTLNFRKGKEQGVYQKAIIIARIELTIFNDRA